MSHVPILPQTVRPQSDAATIPAAERRHVDKSRHRFADSFANARADRAIERPASGRACGAQTRRQNTDSTAAHSDDGAVARARLTAQQRDQVQSLMLSGAMKFAVTRGDGRCATPEDAVASQPDIAEHGVPVDVVTADSTPEEHAGTAVLDDAALKAALPPMSWGFPTAGTPVAATLDLAVESQPDVISIADDVTPDDPAAQSTDVANSAFDLSPANAATIAALQLVATLPLEFVSSAPESVAADTAVSAPAVSGDDTATARIDDTISSLPEVTGVLLVEDHFDVPAEVLECTPNDAEMSAAAMSAAAMSAAAMSAAAAPAPATAPDSAAEPDGAAASTTPAAASAAAAAGGIDRKTVQTDIAKLSPEFRERLERVIERMRLEYGHDVRVIETIRSQARQDALYAQGRTTPGPVVTWTRNSRHIKGLAADLIVDGAWRNPEGYAHLADIAKEEGLRTLGSRDAGHVEMIGGTPVSGETLDTLLNDVQSEAGHNARDLRASVTQEAPTQSARAQKAPPQESHQSTMARVANIAQVARVATVASVAAVAKVAQVARPGASMSNSTQGGETYSPLAASAVPSMVGSTDTSMHVAAPISTVNLADRISHLMDLQATQSAKPLNSVLLRMGNAGGIEDQIRVDTRGTSVDARLGLGNAQQAAALNDRLGELREALERRGLSADGVRVQSTSAARPVDAASAVRSISPTLELAAMRAAADSHAQGNSRDQSTRDQAQREAFARDQSRHTPRPSPDDARQRSRREQQENRR